jgi:hypothetical protein
MPIVQSFFAAAFCIAGSANLMAQKRKFSKSRSLASSVIRVAAVAFQGGKGLAQQQ